MVGGEEIVRIITIGATVAFTCVLRGAALKKGRGDVRRGKIATANRWKQYGTNMPQLFTKKKKKTILWGADRQRAEAGGIGGGGGSRGGGGGGGGGEAAWKN